MGETAFLKSLGYEYCQCTRTDVCFLSELALVRVHSSVPAWRIPGTRQPGGLPSMGSHRVGHDWSDSAAAAAIVMRHCGSFKKIPMAFWDGPPTVCGVYFSQGRLAFSENHCLQNVYLNKPSSRSQPLEIWLENQFSFFFKFPGHSDI